MYVSNNLDASRPVLLRVNFFLYHLCWVRFRQQCRPSAQFSSWAPGQSTAFAQVPQGNSLLPVINSQLSPSFFNPPEGSEGVFLFFRRFFLRPKCNYKDKLSLGGVQSDSIYKLWGGRLEGARDDPNSVIRFTSSVLPAMRYTNSIRVILNLYRQE